MISRAILIQHALVSFLRPQKTLAQRYKVWSLKLFANSIFYTVACIDMQWYQFSVCHTKEYKTWQLANFARVYFNQFF
jgi:hypothetical protein